MKKYLIILVCVLLCSCVSTRKVRNQSLEVAKFDIEKFNGNYVNEADSSKDFNSNESLFPQLFPNEFLSRDNSITITEKAIINFTFDKHKKLILTATENGKVLYKLRLKGEIKGDYFSVRRKLFLIPFPFIYYSYKETKYS